VSFTHALFRRVTTMGRTAFVLSGGGAKGSFQLGALDYLIRDGSWNPEVFVGVSTGALNASFLAQANMTLQDLQHSVDDLRALWFSIDENSDIYTKDIEGVFGPLVGGGDALYNFKPLRKKIKTHVDPQRIRESGRKLRIGVVELKTARYLVVDELHPHIREMVFASASMPFAAPPVRLGGGVYVDGGVREITPLGATFDALKLLQETTPINLDSPDTIFVLLASPLAAREEQDEGQLNSGKDLGGRALGLLENEVYLDDLRWSVQLNEAVKFYLEQPAGSLSDFPFKNYHYANVVVIEPDRLHMDTLEFDEVKIQCAFKAGRDQAAKILAEMNNIKVPCMRSNAKKCVQAARDLVDARAIPG
jgi:NTE family protein